MQLKWGFQGTDNGINVLIAFLAKVKRAVGEGEDGVTVPPSILPV